MVGRRVVVASIALLLIAASSGVAAERTLSQAPSCAAAPVRYDWNKGAGGAPWVAVGPKRSRLEAWLYSYTSYVADGRVNRSGRMIVRAGVEEKIGWFSRVRGGSRLRVSGRRLDGSGSFSQTFRAAHGAGWYPSGLKVPQAGCWQLTLRTKGWERQLVVEAIEAPVDGTCDPTPVGSGSSVRLTPAGAGIAGAWSWRTPEGGALLYPGGRTPTGGNTKVLWRTTRPFASRPYGEMVLQGTQLDGDGEFRQTFPETNPSGYWPSIPVVPSPGCWLFTVRIGGLPGAAGILVARVVPL
jgi:hypothetical protein